MKRYLGTAIVASSALCWEQCFSGTTIRAGPRLDQPAATVVTPEAKGEKVAPAIQYDREPLWAYGFETPAKPGDTATPQAPPTQELTAQRRSGRADAIADGARQSGSVFTRGCPRRT